MSDKTGDVDYYLSQSGLDSEREKEIGQHIGYRYDVNLVPELRAAHALPQALYRDHGLDRPELAGRRSHGL